MPPIETSDFHNGLVVWDLPTDPRDQVDDYGERKTLAPVSMSGRFEKTQRDILKPDGTTVTLNASLTVYRELKVGALVWCAPEFYNPLNQWYKTGSAGEGTELYQIASIDGDAGDLKNRFKRYEYGLTRYKDSPA